MLGRKMHRLGGGGHLSQMVKEDLSGEHLGPWKVRAQGTASRQLEQQVQRP